MYKNLHRSLLIKRNVLGFQNFYWLLSKSIQTTTNVREQQSVFNRNVKLIHRERIAAQETNNNKLASSYVDVCDYLHNYVASVVCDRVGDLTSEQRNSMRSILDLSTTSLGGQHVSNHLLSLLSQSPNNHQKQQLNIYQCNNKNETNNGSNLSEKVKIINVNCDEESLPFESNQFDLAVSSCILHWINDLPNVFKKIYSCLRPNSPFVGALLGGDTLHELRQSLQLAELERLSGFTSHVSPMTTGQDVASILSGAGFRLITVDIDQLRVHYPSMFELMFDLQSMGENNAVIRACTHMHRDSMLAASAIYHQSHFDSLSEKVAVKDDENHRADQLNNQGIPATFQIIHFIGWKEPKTETPTKTQPME